MGKDEYIQQIIDLLEQSHDMQMIDYIYTLLKKCA